MPMIGIVPGFGEGEAATECITKLIKVRICMMNTTRTWQAAYCKSVLGYNKTNKRP